MGAKRICSRLRSRPSRALLALCPGELGEGRGQVDKDADAEDEEEEEEEATLFCRVIWLDLWASAFWETVDFHWIHKKIKLFAEGSTATKC